MFNTLYKLTKTLIDRRMRHFIHLFKLFLEQYLELHLNITM